MSSLSRALLLWLVLGGISISHLLPKVLPEDLPVPRDVYGMLILPALGVWLTAWAVAALPDRKLVRVGFWVVTGAAWLSILYVADTRGILVLAAGLIALNMVVLAWRRLPAWRTIREAATGASVLAIAITAFVLWYNAKTRALISRAEARWAEIGLPMAEFEKTLVPTHENAGSEVLRQAFRERIAFHFYKEESAAGQGEPPIAPSKAAEDLLDEAVHFISAERPPSDDIDLSSIKIPLIEAQAQMLDADYRRLLAAEPSGWACDPHDSDSVFAPHFLGIRRFAQVIAADALRRISAGDQEGAGRAFAAGMRLREGLRENPTLNALMVDVAIERLFATEKLRLPASGDELKLLAADAASLRAEMMRRLQFEAWVSLHMPRQLEDTWCPTPVGDKPNSSFLQRCHDRMIEEPWLRREGAIAALNQAEYTVIRRSPATMSLPDLGEELDNAISTANPSVAGVPISRAWMRLEACLLLQEQVALIRQARARMAAGQPVESRNSVVLPHLRWELIADAEKNTVATRLADAPEWIVNSTVTGYDFWVLPIDGSVAWQFRAPSRTASKPGRSGGAAL